MTLHPLARRRTLAGDRTGDLRCADDGGPPVPPEQLFKASFPGYLLGIRPEWQVMRGLEVDGAHRLPPGLRFADGMFDASAFGQNRSGRFDGKDIAQAILDRMLEQAIAQGRASGTPPDTDGTHRKARANGGRRDGHMGAKRRAACLADPDAALAADRALDGKKPLAPMDRRPPVTENMVGRTDPDAGSFVRDGKPAGSSTSTTPAWTGSRDHRRHPCHAREPA